VTVTLDEALASLPEGSRACELSDDADEMRDHVAFCLAVAGWKAVRETFARLLEALDASPVAATCYAAAQALVNDLSAELERVEKRARAIINARLDVSQQQLQAAAETFLTGLEISRLDLRLIDKLPQGALRLRAGAHLDALRDLQRDLVPLNREVANAARMHRAIAEGPREYPRRERLLSERGEMLAKARTRRAERVHETSRRWPLAAWLTDLEPDVRERDLLQRVIAELALVRDSIVAVRKEVTVGTDWPRGTVTAEQFRRGVRPPLLGIDDLGENPFATNIRTPRGPWRYPLMIGRALEEMGHATPSTVASSAQEAMGGVTATGLVWTLNGGIAVLGTVFPPAGLVLGATMAVWNLMVELDERATKKAAYRASLDPAQSLDVEPSLRGAVAGVLGVVGSVVPGWTGFVIGGAEVVVRLTGDGG
jgi:hypothetical protein